MSQSTPTYNDRIFGSYLARFYEAAWNCLSYPFVRLIHERDHLREWGGGWFLGAVVTIFCLCWALGLWMGVTSNSWSLLLWSAGIYVGMAIFLPIIGFLLFLHRVQDDEEIGWKEA